MAKQGRERNPELEVLPSPERGGITVDHVESKTANHGIVSKAAAQVTNGVPVLSLSNAISRRAPLDSQRRGDPASRSVRETRVSAERPVNRLARHERKREPWQIQKDALSQKFGSQGWAPRKRLSPDALEGIRALHSQDPEKYTTPALASQFEISPEGVRRILKSKWRPSEEEEEARRQRWDKRGEKIWGQMVEIGIKPPKRWRKMGQNRGDQNGVLDGSRALDMSSSITTTTQLRSSVEDEEPYRISLSDRIL